MQRKVPFFILFSPFNSGLAAISSASLMPYSRLMLNTVSSASLYACHGIVTLRGREYCCWQLQCCFVSQPGPWFGSRLWKGYGLLVRYGNSRRSVPGWRHRWLWQIHCISRSAGRGSHRFRWYGMFLLYVGSAAWNTQCASDEYFLVTAGVQFDDVRLADAVHAGDGVETLSFFDSMQKIRLILLCYCTDTACTGKQQGADNAVNRFHSVIVGLCLQFPKVAAKVRILWHSNQRIALRNNIVHFKTEK